MAIQTTADDVRVAAAALLESLDRSLAGRADALAAAGRLREVADSCHTPRLMHAVMGEASGIATDVEEDESSTETQRDEVLAFLNLVELAGRETVTA